MKKSRSKPVVLFWLGQNRKMETLVLDSDLQRLKKVATLQIQIAPTDRHLTPAEVIRISKKARAVITTWGAPSYTEGILRKCHDLQLYARFGGSLRGVIDPSAWKRGIKESPPWMPRASFLPI